MSVRLIAARTGKRIFSSSPGGIHALKGHVQIPYDIFVKIYINYIKNLYSYFPP